MEIAGDPSGAVAPPAAAAAGRQRAAAEGIATAIAGGALGALTGVWFGVAIPCAVVGALNGAVSGARGVYRWRSLGGPVGFVLDSTWGLPMTLAALAAHVVAFVQADHGGYVAALSARQNRHVYERGLRFRPGFLMTTGNVVNGAGASVHTSRRRRKTVTDHEDVHVWQARWWGPLFPLLYVGWTIGAGVIGAVVWLVRRRDEPFMRVVETCAYYLNPFEWWAYSRDDHWPPRKKVRGVGWSMPVVRPFSSTGRRFGRGHRPDAATPR